MPLSGWLQPLKGGAMRSKKQGFKDAQREVAGWSAPLERRALAWLAARTPRWINSDHLSLLGLAAALLAGFAYLFCRWDPAMLHVVNLALLLNWLGDSLDGTLARYRHHCRPRYGFYVDHVIDAFGALFVVGGLGLSGLMSPAVALLFLVAYYILAINVYLATYTLGVFRISFGALGATELRVVLACANLGVWLLPAVQLFGLRVLVFDISGVLCTAGMLGIAVKATIENTVRLYRMERLPPA
jgi:archaetidylinositol phosphate synthase